MEDIAGTGLGGFGALSVFGNIILGGPLQVVLLNGFTPVSGDRFDFIAYSGTRTGAFASEDFPTLLPGLSGTLTYDDLHGDVELGVTGSSSGAPEPSTLLLLAAGITGWIFGRHPGRA